MSYHVGLETKSKLPPARLANLLPAMPPSALLPHWALQLLAQMGFKGSGHGLGRAQQGVEQALQATQLKRGAGLGLDGGAGVKEGGSAAPACCRPLPVASTSSLRYSVWPSCMHPRCTATCPTEHSCCSPPLCRRRQQQADAQRQAAAA